MKTNFLKSTLFIIAFFILNSSYSQTNYYVSKSGQNTNSGSIYSPWLTIQYALNNIPSNSILNIDTGVYNEKITIPVDRVTIQNLGTVVIDATKVTAPTAIISIINKNNVTINGLILQNNIQKDAQGILISGTSGDVTIKNCIIRNIHFSANANATVTATTNAQGIIVYGNNYSTPVSNLIITNNSVYDCRLGFSEAIAVNGNVDTFEITGNNVYNVTNIGIDIIGHEGVCANPTKDQARNGIVKSNIVHHCLSKKATAAGIYIDGAKDILVQNNTSHDNGYGIEVGCENLNKTTENITIKNNVIYNNQTAGIALGGFDYPKGSGKVINSVFTNNTCLKNDASNTGNGEIYLSYSENCKIENNIFYTNSQNNIGYTELTQPKLIFNYNNFYCDQGSSALQLNWNGIFCNGFESITAKTNTNSNSISDSPQLVNSSVTNPDFHLSIHSKCINSGNPNYSTTTGETDYFNQSRLQDNRIDIGAHELDNSLNTNSNYQLNELMIYPNPSNGDLYIQKPTNFTDAKASVYNLLGQKITEIKLIDTTIIKNLALGYYNVVIEKQGKTIVKKIIVN